TNIQDKRRFFADVVESFQRQFDAESSSYRNQMDDGIGGTAAGHGDADGIFQSPRRHNVPRTNILFHQLDDLLSGRFRHMPSSRIRSGNRRTSRESHS